jgi:hypothetical protein
MVLKLATTSPVDAEKYATDSFMVAFLTIFTL